MSGPGKTTRILREALQSVGGAILAERYFPVEEVEFEAAIGQIISSRPNFVFTTLIGQSVYAFLRALRRATLARGIDQPNDLPVASCSLAEPELVEIGPEAWDGHLSSSVYFETIDSQRNRDFVRRYRAAFPDAGPTLADAEASYIAVLFLARAVRHAHSASLPATLAALPFVSMDAPQGEVQIDPDNRHCLSHPTDRRLGPQGRLLDHLRGAAPRPPRPVPGSGTTRRATRSCRGLPD